MDMSIGSWNSATECNGIQTNKRQDLLYSCSDAITKSIRVLYTPPIENKEEKEKEEFYVLLEGEVDKTPNNDIILWQILEKAWEFSTPIYQVFIAFKQAYDSIQRKPLYSAMKEIGIPDKPIRLTRITMEEAKGIVKFLQQKTLKLNKVVRVTNVDADETILNKKRQTVEYANDLDLIARSKRALREGYEKLKQKSTKIELKLNVNKTKAMEIKTEAGLGQNWIMNNSIEVVQGVTYNYELRQIYKDLDIRLRWAGHVERMPEGRIPRRITRGDMIGYTTRERPRTRWKDNVRAMQNKTIQVDRLQEESVRQQLENKLNERLERNRPIYDTIEEEWTELQTIMTEAAERMLENIEPKRKEFWYDDD
ncbi:hypothetical protein ILUMI_02198, partial [Ignelater luminosus]